MSLRLIRALLWIGLFVPFCSLLAAQETEKTAPITFQVKDMGDAGIPSAHIKLLASPGAAAKEFEADYGGKLTLSLPTGIYDFEVTSQGFRHETRRIEVHKGESQTIIIELQVGHGSHVEVEVDHPVVLMLSQLPTLVVGTQSQGIFVLPIGGTNSAALVISLAPSFHQTLSP